MEFSIRIDWVGPQWRGSLLKKQKNNKAFKHFDLPEMRFKRNSFFHYDLPPQPTLPLWTILQWKIT